ncbi:multiple C2 and transmembrane domain-containing protein 2 [Pyrus ussuriensis x Pyrus communis]|uniref:Multiple C2 and transmembrane domain-containing protein 2 n=1 Tax=Pyrus ussuriensis x Pyrus communis TaxID=2448454 RepID=A0A5N5I4P4_9ROSA|nr:multiple C2 and transmembrane domain-containing protein 2 [Pyrus ussuriensis x Pyrus communis]
MTVSFQVVQNHSPPQPSQQPPHQPQQPPPQQQQQPPPQQQQQPPPQPQPPSEPPQQPSVVRKLIVEVVDARDLLPKDGQGSSSPYVVADFDGQRKRTSTKFKSLNPVWNEPLEFIVSDPDHMEYEELEIEVLNDKRFGTSSGSARKNHFLGRVKLYGTQFSKRGDEGLVYFQLEKKSVFSWIRGEIGLRIYYYDEMVEESPPPPPPEDPPQEKPRSQPPGVVVFEEGRVSGAHGMPVENTIHHKGSHSPPVVVIEESPPPMVYVHSEPLVQEMSNHQHEEVQFQPEVRKMEMNRVGLTGERVRIQRRPNGDYAPKVISGKFVAKGAAERIHPCGLVEPMQYLFIRIVKARGLAPNENPYVRVRTSAHVVRSKVAVHRQCEPTDSPEWNQVFALPHNRPESAGSELQISIHDSPSEQFLGGICFDMSEVPVRDPPDSPLAPQWWRLDSSAGDQHPGRVSGDIQLSVWFGTQADDAFPEAWSSDAPFVAHTRSKVYQSPKLWYLRTTVMEVQDLHIPSNLPPLTAPEIRIKAQLGSQSARTRRGSMNNHCASFHWNEDLIFVAGDPLEDSLILLVEDRTNKDAALLGHVQIPVSSIEQRIDDRYVASKWLPLECGGGGGGPCVSGGDGSFCGRIHLRLCLEGGYHVLDEAAHVCSDFRPTAKQLWKPAVGILELGILGARGLLPMKAKSGGKGSTDAYCVAKYGRKWVRTRTVMDSFDPRWNEQYTWQVYDPCTVLTIGVFDNWRMFATAGEEKPDYSIGKVRIRISTMESNKVYTNSYPLLVLLRTGLKKMGEIELAVRFAYPSLLPETCAVYGQPLLPRMHYLRPLGVAQQEALRGAATRMVAAWLARSEPPLGQEVVRYMLDADSHAWSMRKSKANWFRIVAVLAWVVGLAKWLDSIRRWRNPVTTVLVHVLYLVLVWYPDMIVPTGFLYVFLIGVWYYRFRPKSPAGMDIRLSQADSVDPDELDEEFDTIPSSRPSDIIRVRYDRLRMLAARVQTVLGDFATQGERAQALVSWRDPRATKLFIGVCLAITVVLYAVPPKMVAVALGFYYLRHPMFRGPMPPVSLNFFRRLPSLSDRLM